MTVKPESNFIKGVHAHLNPQVYRMKTNNPYVAGIPDCYYSGTGGALWVEYKFIPKLPMRVPINIDLSALQLAWITGRRLEGRDIFIIVGSPEGGIVLNPSDLDLTISAAQFRNIMLSKKEIAGVIELNTLKR